MSQVNRLHSLATGAGNESVQPSASAVAFLAPTFKQLPRKLQHPLLPQTPMLRPHLRSDQEPATLIIPLAIDDTYYRRSTYTRRLRSILNRIHWPQRRRREPGTIAKSLQIFNIRLGLLESHHHTQRSFAGAVRDIAQWAFAAHLEASFDGGRAAADVDDAGCGGGFLEERFEGLAHEVRSDGVGAECLLHLLFDGEGVVAADAGVVDEGVESER